MENVCANSDGLGRSSCANKHREASNMARTAKTIRLIHQPLCRELYSNVAAGFRAKPLTGTLIRSRIRPPVRVVHCFQEALWIRTVTMLSTSGTSRDESQIH